jgi:glycosyltransferase involved in cell wall biosynthesis
MKLLITTQTVDRDDPILGFFHGWLLEFAKHFEYIHVICLREGKHTLPPNVYVHSLGKEYGVSYPRYLWRLCKYAWRLRDEYDLVFSHMNPHYIVLFGWFWMTMGKRMFFWRNHAKMNWMTRVAARFARRVFYTSPYACTRIFPHAVQMPVGINTDLFCPQKDVVRDDHSVLFLGRLSPVKRPQIFMEASKLLPAYSFHSYGSEPGDAGTYEQKLASLANGHVMFHKSIPNYETPRVYATSAVYVNLTPEGSMDKTVLEAAACGTLVLVSNKSFQEFLPPPCLLSLSNPESLAQGIRALGEMPEEKKEAYRAQLVHMVEEKHSLKKLATVLVTQFRA